MSPDDPVPKSIDHFYCLKSRGLHRILLFCFHHSHWNFTHKCPANRMGNKPSRENPKHSKFKRAAKIAGHLNSRKWRNYYTTLISNNKNFYGRSNSNKERCFFIIIVFVKMKMSSNKKKSWPGIKKFVYQIKKNIVDLDRGIFWSV